MAVGNALGSNITNITLVLGASALVGPLAVHSRIIKQELPILLGAMSLALLLMWNGRLERLDGAVLLGVLLLMMGWMTWQGLRGQREDALTDEVIEELPAEMSTPRALFWLLAGLVLLSASSKLLVWGAVHLAQAFGVSDLIIGLTIIAIGTSLPELAASIAGAVKNEHDIVIGNVVGSNLFNTLGVLAVPALIAPAELADGVMRRDMPVVFVLTLALFIMAYGFRKPGQITRLEGLLLLIGFAAYQLLLFNTVIR